MPESITITARDINRNPGFFLKKAKKYPVIVDFYKKPSFVVMAYENYLEYQKLLKDKSKKAA